MPPGVPDPRRNDADASAAERSGADAAASGGLVIVRYSEIGLKGENRSWFEERLARNMRDRLHGLGVERIERRRGRIFVRCAAAEPSPEIVARLADTPGIRSLSRARTVARDFDAICGAARALAREPHDARRPPPATFRISTNRADQTFPKTSMQVDAEVGGAVLEACPGLRARMNGPDLTIAVEIQPEHAYVMGDWHDGPGGLPVGSSGPIALLLSGGIDSPVAGFLLQKRGCAVSPLYCHAFPFTGDAAREKVRDLARALARRQTILDLRVADIAPAQVALRDRCRPEMLVVLYRRLMVRLAERVALAIGAHAIGTGENLGQVASQTLPNLHAIDAAATLPILRPLATYDKEETINLARRLGTFEISIRPADDCCQLFVPKHPATRVAVEAAAAEEAKVDLPALVDAVFAKIETERFYRGEPSKQVE